LAKFVLEIQKDSYGMTRAVDFSNILKGKFIPNTEAVFHFMCRFHSRIALRRLKWATGRLFVLFIGYSTLQPLQMFAHNSMPTQPAPLVSEEIRYQINDAVEVFLVWGMNGWNVVPEELRPAGTVIENAVMHTTTAREWGNTFVARVQIPSGAKINYGFLITKSQTGKKLHYWDDGGNTDKGYHKTVKMDGITWVSAFPPVQKQVSSRAAEVSLVSHKIRYQNPEAGEVVLVWGINGWDILPEKIRPKKTAVEGALMYTRTVREGDDFTFDLNVPPDAVIDFCFLITRKRAGAAIQVWEDNAGQNFHAAAAQNAVTEIKTKLSLDQARELPTVFDISAHVLIAIYIIFGVGLLLRWISPAQKPRAVTLALSGLILVGLALRLWAAWDMNQSFPDTPERLAGDEPGYDYLAYSLLQGEFFQWPCRTPVYPLFLAACYQLFGHSYAMALYAQAFVSAAAVPLTYLLARYFVGIRGALLAATMVALHPALVFHGKRLYTESLYTPLLLLVLLSLMWSFKKPLVHRFILAGATLAIATLCRPATALLPLILPFILPRTWGFGRKMLLWAVYAGAMVAVIAPWSYHNYRTYHTFMPLSISGVVLWHGSPEFYHLMEQERHLLQIWEHKLSASRNGGYDPCTITGDSYFTARSMASIRAEKEIYAWYFLKKLAYFWIGHPVIDWPHYAIFSLDALRPYFTIWQIVSILLTRLLPVAVLVGLFFARDRLKALAPMLIICGYFTIIHAITYAEIRYSEPLHPVLAIVFVAAITEIYRKIKNEKPIRQPGIDRHTGLQ
jgi:hypothetical protein